MFRAVLVVCAGAALSAPAHDDAVPRVGDKCGYESCTSADPALLNVHIVPHTHDDVGWLKTVDQYYYGSRNNIQKAGVQYILDSVIKELWEDPKRRFIYVETAFFWKWWTRQPAAVQGRVRALVRQGRLQMVGGAWSMNDEAASHYHSTIDQFTWGLSKLNQTFGECGRPRVGWQIDPFGHSREFASLLAAMGYDGLFLGRIDYQDKGYRLRAKNMEMVWRGDDVLGKPSDIFTGVLYNTYSPPPGFCFDVLCDDEPVIDDASSPMFNVDQKVARFLEYVGEQAKRYRTNNVLVTMGGDFTYQDAGMWYTNLDKLIQHTNLKAAKDDLNVKAFYSTPDCYLKAVKDAYPSLPTKQDDFFPYASDPTAFWTGYFTSRPTTKYFEREANAFLQMVKQLQVLLDLPKHNQFVIDELKSAMGVMQHHDAITGTEKQHVAHDYERMLSSALDDAALVARHAFKKVMQGDSRQEQPELEYQRCRFNESSCPVTEDSRSFVVTVYNPLGWEVKEAIRIPVVEGNYTVYISSGTVLTSQLVDIPKPVLRIPTRVSKATHELVFLADLVPLGFQSYYVTRDDPKMKRHAHTEDIEYTNIDDYWGAVKAKPYYDIRKLVVSSRRPEHRVPDAVNYDGDVRNVRANELDVEVLRDRGDEISEDILQLERIIKEAKRSMVKAARADPPENQAKRLNYPSLNDEEMRMLSDEPLVVTAFGDTVVENEFSKLRLDRATGQLVQVVTSNVTLNLSIGMHYWPACYGNNTGTSFRSSGAYIFRPNSTAPRQLQLIATSVRRGPVVSELRFEYAGNASSTVRLYRGLDLIEHDFLVGSIPLDDGVGKEYVVRYESDLVNGGSFYTDSNGRQVLKRRLGRRPQWNLTLAEPVAGNYYPVTNQLYIEADGTRLAVLTDRAQGGTSLGEGQLELMLHRRLLHDDAFGVGEALNEVANGAGLAVRGRHRILVRDPSVATQVIAAKKQLLQFHYQPMLFVSNAQELPLAEWLTKSSSFKGMRTALPVGVHLLTLEPWSGTKLLLRLENYLDGAASAAVVVDLSALFSYVRIISYEETSLAANRWLKDTDKWSWRTDQDFVEESKSYSTSGEDHRDGGLKVQIKPKQIRTFIVEYELTQQQQQQQQPSGTSTPPP